MHLHGPHTPLLALAVTAVALGASWSLLSRSDDLIGQSYAKALASQAQHVQASRGAPGGGVPEVDLLQLSSAPAEQPFGLSRPVTRGDRITIAGRDGQLRSLEVTDVRTLGSDEANGHSGVLLVTCKVAGSDPAATVRFLIESAAPETGLAPYVHRAL